MTYALCEESRPVTNIKVVGIGGGGGNAVNGMIEYGLKNVEFIVMNSDDQDLLKLPNIQKVQLGKKLVCGHGAGGVPQIGRRCAEESHEEISKTLENCQMVFLAATMGGGTGTGATPVVAKIARDMGILTVGIVTKPFAFEGRMRMKQAEEGIQALLREVDCLIVIPNERLKFISEKRITMMNAFAAANDVLRQGVESVTSLLNTSSFINIDFADIHNTMRNTGYAHMGIGQANGANPAMRAAHAAVTSPLLETSIKGAKGLIFNIYASPDAALEDIEAAAASITEATHPDANIIWGVTFANAACDFMKITVVATGFDAHSDASSNSLYEFDVMSAFDRE